MLEQLCYVWTTLMYHVWVQRWYNFWTMLMYHVWATLMYHVWTTLVYHVRTTLMHHVWTTLMYHIWTTLMYHFEERWCIINMNNVDVSFWRTLMYHVLKTLIYYIWFWTTLLNRESHHTPILASLTRHFKFFFSQFKQHCTYMKHCYNPKCNFNSTRVFHPKRSWIGKWRLINCFVKQ